MVLISWCVTILNRTQMHAETCSTSWVSSALLLIHLHLHSQRPRRRRRSSVTFRVHRTKPKTSVNRLVGKPQIAQTWGRINSTHIRVTELWHFRHDIHERHWSETKTPSTATQLTFHSNHPLNGKGTTHHKLRWIWSCPSRHSTYTD